MEAVMTLKDNKTNPKSEDEDEEKKKLRFTLGDRLEFGMVTIDELAELSQQSRWKLYDDIKFGRLHVVKSGRSTRVRGPVAKAYLAGQPMPLAAA
jgi:hypothetical protein